MDITPVIPSGRQVITGYGDGGFSINQQRAHGSLIVFTHQSVAWDVANADNLKETDFDVVLNTLPPVELLLVGTGNKVAALPSGIKTMFQQRRVALEVMDTGAACRTYNVLMSEERRVAAALIAV